MLTANAFFLRPMERLTAEEEACFFRALKTSNDTFKLTGRGRLREIDAALVDQVAAAGGRIRETLDLGISSGVTTLELLEALRIGGHGVAVTGTDRSLEALLVSLPFGCRALVEPGGHVLQYEVFGRPIRPWGRRLDYVTGMLAVRGLIDLLLRKRAARRSRQPRFARKVTLVSPRLARSSAVALVEDDVTRANPSFIGRFDLIRAANILNRGYFGERDMAQAIDNVLTYLSGPGAWLLIVRTEGAGEHHGTLFRLDEAGALQVVRRFGRGSEIEAVVLQRAAGQP